MRRASLSSAMDARCVPIGSFFIDTYLGESYDDVR